MKPKFDTPFEYDKWYEEEREKQILDEYFSKEVVEE